MSFPRFNEYVPGTILEISSDNVNDKKPFLILILKDTNHNGVSFRNSGEEAIAVWIDEGGCIIKNYRWKINSQIIKRGGLINDNKRRL